MTLTPAGSGNLTISGSGAVAFGRNASVPAYDSGYSGNIIVSNGSTLSLRNEQSMGNTTGFTTIQNGGILQLDTFRTAALMQKRSSDPV